MCSSLGRRITGLEYDAVVGYLRIALDDGSVLLVSSCRDGCHVVVDLPRRSAVVAHEVSE
jgi:hypothetical protein